MTSLDTEWARSKLRQWEARLRGQMGRLVLSPWRNECQLTPGIYFLNLGQHWEAKRSVLKLPWRLPLEAVWTMDGRVWTSRVESLILIELHRTPLIRFERGFDHHSFCSTWLPFHLTQKPFSHSAALEGGRGQFILLAPPFPQPQALSVCLWWAYSPWLAGI